MSRFIPATAALLLLAASGAAQSPAAAAHDALNSGVKRLERAEYAEALKDFEKALDTYASEQRLDTAQREYMQMFVGSRHHANTLMKAMKAWVLKHRSGSAGLPPAAFAAFDAWVQERDALAAATINLVHNSPDWK